MSEDAEKSPLEFPCEFQVKAMGRNEPGFEELVAAIVRRHLADDASLDTRLNPSRADRYLAVRCHFVATSRDQLDAIYRDLTAEPAVLVAL